MFVQKCVKFISMNMTIIYYNAQNIFFCLLFTNARNIWSKNI